MSTLSLPLEITEACQQHVVIPALIKVLAVHALLPVQVVFVGVFLLTRASQPGAAAAGHAAELQPLGSKACVAHVGDEAEHPLAPGAGEAPSDSHRWQLSAVRSAQSGE